eukprot:TRINITY_DN2732_c0_g1_i1.p1 TRINITY_DN2732_c0_g1~~TRINITY_DN2732_c0_g1_i1.p1  ORF type:complete len:619 (-),score=152.24 TRINITY_DN2732_c0_g1_i1:224-2080(-)
MRSAASSPSPRDNWKRLAAAAVKHHRLNNSVGGASEKKTSGLSKDPWESFPVEDIHAERVRRYRYVVSDEFQYTTAAITSVKEDEKDNTFELPLHHDFSTDDKANGTASSNLDIPEYVVNMTSKGCSWIVDEAVVKITPEPFAHGAMRNCFRMKKLPQDPHAPSVHVLDWKHAPNYVAKNYRNDDQTPKSQYFLDVRVQAEAAYWAKRYNMRNPPKKVDMIYVFVIEMIDRPDCPLFCVERFIEGDYIKHNSNSGFLEDKFRRLTPQCFSHFTYHESDGELIVVDVQGVDDLYTDPQIHTQDYRFGTGDMGFRGMALFFSTHSCNPLCKLLQLPEFDHTVDEVARMPVHSESASSTGETVGSVKFDSAFKPFHDPANEHLAMTHFELAQLHVQGRFSKGVPDYLSALYHLHLAARGGVKEALVSLAKCYSGMDSASNEAELAPSPDGSGIYLFPKDILNRSCPKDLQVAVSLWKYAAEYGSLEGMVQLSRAYKEGTAFGQPFEKDWSKAMIWAEQARKSFQQKALKHIKPDEDNEDELSIRTPTSGDSASVTLDSGPVLLYHILMDEAEMLSQGGFQLDKDIDSARDLYFEAGTQAMKECDMYIGNLCFKKAEQIEAS